MALLAVTTPERLSHAIRAAIEESRAHLSTIVYWEVMLKAMKGALDVGDPRQWWVEALDAFQARPIPLRADHISAIHDLPPIHKDPFDRAMIAQATVEDLTLLSTDTTIRQYTHAGFHVIC